MAQPSVKFVSLGPGNAELMTLACYRELEKADIIFCPCTTGRGKDDSSRAADIIEAVGVSRTKIRLFYVPMMRRREAAVEAYRQCADDIRTECLVGRRVAVAVEGDISIYASTQTIVRFLQSLGIGSELVAGIPSFIAAATALGEPLIMGEGGLLVGCNWEQISAHLERGLTHGSSIVCMKVKNYEADIKAYLCSRPDIQCFYYEFLGMGAEEFTTQDISAISERRFPYFASMILYKPFLTDRDI